MIDSCHEEHILGNDTKKDLRQITLELKKSNTGITWTRDIGVGGIITCRVPQINFIKLFPNVRSDISCIVH